MPLISSARVRSVSANQSTPNLKASAQNGACPMSLISSARVRSVSANQSTNNLKATAQKGACSMPLISSSSTSSDSSTMLSTSQREKLVMSDDVKRLIDSFIRKYSKSACPDLQNSLQTFGLAEAWNVSEKFDPSRGVKFTSYAFNFIERAILDAIDKYSNPIYVPYGNTSEAGVAARNWSGSTVPESEGNEDDNDNSLPINVVAAPSETDPDGDIPTQEEAVDQLQILLDGIPEKERLIFTRVKGILGQKKTPENEIAREYGVSSVRICQIVKKCMTKMTERARELSL